MVSLKEGMSATHVGAFLAGSAAVLGLGLLLRQGLKPSLGKDWSWLGMGVALPFFARKAQLTYRIYGPARVRDSEGNRVVLPTKVICEVTKGKRVYEGGYTVDLSQKPLGKGSMKTVRPATGPKGERLAEVPMNKLEAKVALILKPDAKIFKAPPGVGLEYVEIQPRAIGDLKSGQLLENPDYKKMFRQLAEQLQKIHGMTVNGKPATHRDLKPNNILLEAGGGVRLTDFGWIHSAPHYIGGSPRYLPPETRLGIRSLFTLGNWDQRSEIYVLGMLFLQILRGERGQREPISGMGSGAGYLARYSFLTEEKVEALIEGLGDEYEDFKFLLRGMLAFKPDERPPLAQIISDLAK